MSCGNLTLKELLHAADVTPLHVSGPLDELVSGISTHAQRTPPGGMFVAVRGTKVDSHLLLSEAVEVGAKFLLVEQAVPSYPGVTVIRVSSTRAALGPIAHAFHGNPAKAMHICAVTGTNGKTTVTTLIYQILNAAGLPCGLIGTLGARFGDEFIETANTTPDALELARMLARMRDAGIRFVAMEASSHAIDQDRIGGLSFAVAAFTNLTQDHLDYHGTLDAYGQAKLRLFTSYLARNARGVACFNGDSEVVSSLLSNWKGPGLRWSEEDPTADIHAQDVRCMPDGIRLTLTLGGETRTVSTQLVGSFNVSNLLAAAACCRGLGLDIDSIVRGMENAHSVPGRFEYINEGQVFTVIVDYAHTPDALERLLRNARRLCTHRLICVFGCGGDRDRRKRPQMGQVAGDHADFVIVTNDNPRTELPEAIASDIRLGVERSCLKPNRCHVVLDRATAIDQAVNIAFAGDVVVIAGKGHEDYQEIGTTRIAFDDREVVRASLRGERGFDMQTRTVQNQGGRAAS